jgi:hypothetical protein
VDVAVKLAEDVIVAQAINAGSFKIVPLTSLLSVIGISDFKVNKS